MALRSFGLMTIQSASQAQPLIGSWITAGIGAPSNVPTVCTLGTAASASGTTDADALFAVGDPVWLVDPNGSNFENARISAISGNTVTLGPQNTSPGGHFNPVTLNPHTSGAFGTGTFILLKQSVNNLFVQLEDGGGSAYDYIGTSPLMHAGFRRLAKLPPVTAGQNCYNWSATENFGGNPFDTSELWILGGSGLTTDAYTPSYCVV